MLVDSNRCVGNDYCSTAYSNSSLLLIFWKICSYLCLFPPTVHEHFLFAFWTVWLQNMRISLNIGDSWEQRKCKPSFIVHQLKYFSYFFEWGGAGLTLQFQSQLRWLRFLHQTAQFSCLCKLLALSWVDMFCFKLWPIDSWNIENGT